MSSVNGVILTNRSAADRSSTDFYETPENVTVALLNFLLLSATKTIWEPACGNGKIVRVLQNRGYRVVATDIEGDFLKADPRGDFILTNPPFSLSQKFIERAIEIKKPFAFLLKSQYWHAVSRSKLFHSYRPSYVLPLTWRPDFLFGKKGGAPTMECIWTVWDSKPASVTDYFPLHKPV